MNYSWKVQVFKVWDEVDDPSFIEQWRRWMEISPDAHVFNHPSLVKAWTDIYRSLQDIQPLYIVAEADGVTFFLPLVLWKKNWKNAFLRFIVPAGYSDYDYHDPITTSSVNKEFIDSFWNLIKEKVFFAQNLKYDVIEINNLTEKYVYHELKNNIEICYYLDMKKYVDYDDYLACRKNLRNVVLRKKRMMIRDGDLHYYSFGRHEIENATSCFSRFLEVHSRKWPQAYKPYKFHEQILKVGLPNGIVHFSYIDFNKNPISWHLGFKYKDSFCYYMPAYDDKYSKYSPGKIHLLYLIEECFHSSLLVFDFLRGAEKYKSTWADNSKNLFSVNFNSAALQSRLRSRLHKVINGMKKNKSYF